MSKDNEIKEQAIWVDQGSVAQQRGHTGAKAEAEAVLCLVFEGMGSWWWSCVIH